MLFGGKKERETEDLIKQHIFGVGEVVSALHKAAEVYCADCVGFDDLARAVIEGESKADEIRRGIELNLYRGAFLPVQRGDYARMVEAVDKVANQCESVAQFLLQTRPELDDDSQRGLIEIMNATMRCYDFIPQMCERFDDSQKVMDLANKVEEEEKRVDKVFEGIMTRLFGSDQDLAKKLHVKMLFDRAAAISNRIEDASDHFSIIVQTRPS